jgi:RimJ/RimL family protein N-acetyltransferase
LSGEGFITREDFTIMNRDDIANYAVVEMLRDQRPATIRAIRPGDKGMLQEAFKGLQASSIYTRFFGPRKEFTDRELIEATEIDFAGTVALVACVQENAGERVIGGGRYFTLERTDPPSAEVAFLVEEDFHGLGLASILLRHLLQIGRKQGISRFEADVLHGNKKMLRVFERAGLPIVTKASSDSIHVTMFLNKEEAP